MLTPLEVKALAGFRLWLRYSDGTQGEVDRSDLAGRGVFSLWNDESAFRKVHLGPGGAIAWSDEVELCPDSVYLRLTGESPEKLFPALARRQVA